MSIWDEINSLATEIYERKGNEFSGTAQMVIKFKEEDLILKLYQITGTKDEKRICKIDKYGMVIDCIGYKNKYYPVDVVNDTIVETVRKYDFDKKKQFTYYFEDCLTFKCRAYYSNLKSKYFTYPVNKTNDNISYNEEHRIFNAPDTNIKEPYILLIGRTLAKHLSDYEKSLTNKTIFKLIYTHDSVGVIQAEQDIERYVYYDKSIFSLLWQLYIDYLYIEECQTVFDLQSKHFKCEITFTDNGNAIQDDEMANFLVQLEKYKNIPAAKSTISTRRKTYYEFLRSYKHEIIGE